MTWWTGCKPTPEAPACSSVLNNPNQACCLSDEITWDKFATACPKGFKADPTVDYCTTGLSKYRVKCVRSFC
jgi:hypothetical protein